MAELNSKFLTINGGRDQETIFQFSSNSYSKLDTSLTTHPQTASPINQPELEPKQPVKITTNNINNQLGTRLSCNNCKVGKFDSLSDQKDHFKSDWHRFNLIRKAKALPAVDETTFEELVEDLSSISGSESDDDDDLMPNSDINLQQNHEIKSNQTKYQKKADQSIQSISKGPVVWYKVKDTTSELMGFYKCIFPSNDIPSDSLSLKNGLDNMEGTLWVLIMVGGGHFAAAVFDNSKGKMSKDHKGQPHTMVASKTFHRYTTRRKQGGSQSSNDNAKGGAKSAGATIRRQMETMLKAEIRGLLESWSKYLAIATKVFVRAPSGNHQILYQHDSPPIDPNDSRVIPFPFSTRRPTLKEIQKAYDQLTTSISATLTEDYHRYNQMAPSPAPSTIPSQKIELGMFPSLIGKELKPKVKAKDKTKAKTAESKLNEDFEIESNTQKLTNSMKNDLSQQPKESEKEALPSPSELDKFEIMRNWLEKNIPTQSGYSIEPFVELLDSVPYLKTQPNYRLRSSANSPTLLHLASLYNHSILIPILLDLGCDPNLTFGKDEAKPYQLSSTKPVKNQFRLYRYSHPNKYSWDDAQVSTAISPEELEQKANANKAKQKAKKQNQKTKSKAEPTPKPKPTPSTIMPSTNQISKLGFGALNPSLKPQTPTQTSQLGYGFGSQGRSPTANHLGLGYRLGGSSATPSLSDREARLKAIEARLKKD